MLAIGLGSIPDITTYTIMILDLIKNLAISIVSSLLASYLINNNRGEATMGMFMYLLVSVASGNVV